MNATYKRQLQALQNFFLRNFNNTTLMQPPPEKLYEVPWTMIALLAVLYGGITLVTLLGNGLVMWVVKRSPKMRTVTNHFIANLAFADIIIGLFAIPFQFQAALLQRWHLPEFMCAFCPFIQVLSVNVSVFTLSAVALDRYRAVLYPLAPKISKRRAAEIIAGIWIAGGLAAGPTQWDYKLIKSEHPFHPDPPHCKNDGLPPLVRKYYFLSLVALQYVIPLLTISVAYLRIACRLWGTPLPGNKEASRDALVLQSKKKVIKMLVVVVLLFGVCWLPLQLYNFLQYVHPSINDYPYINLIWFVSHWLAMSNSGCNPFIYAIYSKKFQQEFSLRCGYMKRCCPHLKGRPCPPSSSQAVFNNSSVSTRRGSRQRKSVSFERVQGTRRPLGKNADSLEISARSFIRSVRASGEEDPAYPREERRRATQNGGGERGQVETKWEGGAQHSKRSRISQFPLATVTVALVTGAEVTTDV